MKTEEEYQIEIETVNLEIYECEELLRDIKKRKEQLLIDRYKMRSGLKEGDVVTWKEWGGKKGEIVKKGRIENFVLSFDKVAPNVRIYKADGTIGLNYRDYWNGSTQPIKV